MDNLPEELHIVITSYLSYKDMIMFKSTSNYFHNIIFPEEILYDILPTNKIKRDNLYLKYHRGKSYNTYKGEKDINFTISFNEKIIYQKEHDLKKEYSPEYYIITLNNCYNFILYEFQQEVSSDEYTPEYYGYDENDNDTFILRCTTQYTNLNDIKQLVDFNGNPNELIFGTKSPIKDMKITISNING